MQKDAQDVLLRVVYCLAKILSRKYRLGRLLYSFFLGFYLNSYGDHINQNYLNLDEYLNA